MFKKADEKIPVKDFKVRVFEACAWCEPCQIIHKVSTNRNTMLDYLINKNYKFKLAKADSLRVFVKSSDGLVYEEPSIWKIYLLFIFY